MHTQLTNAITAWEQVLQPEQILLNHEALLRYRRSTLGAEYNTHCVLLPANSNELSQCLKIANKHQIKIFPISRGQNHGYNSAAPLSQDTVIIDLQRLTTILDYNAEFGYVIIEPGVTFGQLYAFLIQNGCQHLVSGFTGSPNASIVGNSLDRGIGKGTFGNRQIATEIKEIVISDGQIIDLRNRYNVMDKTTDLQYAATGLDLSNIFYQSNLAIVTKMIVHLEPLPEVLLTTNISIATDENLWSIIDGLRRLNRLRVIEPVYAINNDVRLFIGSGLHKKFAVDLIKQRDHWLQNYSKWNLSIFMHCACEEDALLKQTLISEHLGKFAANINVDQLSQAEAKALLQQSITTNFAANPKELKFLFCLGYTNEADQKTLYWDTPTQFADRSNPVADGCGLIFFTPKVPFSSEQIRYAVELLRKIAIKYDMETPITLQVKSKQMACLILPILFNLYDENSKNKACSYYKELFAEFSAHGYVPSRLNSISMSQMFKADTAFANLQRQIKAIFDADNLLSVNRY